MALIQIAVFAVIKVIKPLIIYSFHVYKTPHHLFDRETAGMTPDLQQPTVVSRHFLLPVPSCFLPTDFSHWLFLSG